MLKRAFFWIMPHPVLTLSLVLTWLVLHNTFSLGMAIFGLFLGIFIPWMTSIWWPDRPKGFNPFKMFSYSMIVLWDIIIANIQVAKIILTVPNDKLKSTWVAIPLELKQPEAITVLAGTITLTPGTVSADLSDEGHCLLVHTLHTDDPDKVRDDIKNRYERRLLEIFK